ncbi:hypothetical protein A5625_25930 [Mycobacterium sp. 1465703.0]|nr:hypothetical protein A5625_25930 [Mycobacterium sp. 1465703.0]
MLAGITPIVLDSLPGPNTEHRANGIGGPAVRFLDNRGLYEQLSGSAGRPYTLPLGMFGGLILGHPAETSSNQFYMLPVHQPRLTRALAEHAARLGANLRWGAAAGRC